MRHMPNLRRNARERPQRWHRLYLRTAYFGVRFAFTRHDFFAIEPQFTWTGVCPRNGIPSSRRSAIPRSSRFAVVTSVMSIPWIFSTLS